MHPPFKEHYNIFLLPFLFVSVEICKIPTTYTNMFNILRPLLTYGPHACIRLFGVADEQQQ